MSEQVATPGLSESIPANNQKVIEIYNKLRSGQISVNKSYQRKLVWKKSHKLEFIDTILRNFPFPEIYLAPGSLDQIKLILIDEIVDGQQRLTTIRDYIEAKDIFALPRLSIKKFAELNLEEKSVFLNYEISVRYLKNVSNEQVKEIFQRINKTDYSLNSVERLNAQWGESEFVCFAKQVVDADFDLANTVFVISAETKKILSEFFHGKDEDDEGVFTDNDKSRMLAYQYIMTLVATMDAGEYFNRNERLPNYIESYNDSFLNAQGLLDRILRAVAFISSLGINRASRWYKKANLFTLIIEVDKIDVAKVSVPLLTEKLNNLDGRSFFAEVGLDDDANKLTQDEEKYLGFAREAVNQKSSRIYRGDFIRKILLECMQ